MCQVKLKDLIKKKSYEKMILKEDKMNLCEIEMILKWSTHLRHTP